jgi:hypothetical protein
MYCRQPAGRNWPTVRPPMMISARVVAAPAVCRMTPPSSDADDGGQAHRQRPEDHGLHHAGMADGHLGVLTGEDSLAELEARHVAEQGHREGERGHRGGLGRQHEVAAGHSDERRPDHPGGVLGGDRLHGECAEDHRSDHDPDH